jgi:protein involved in polysaccharide export with SLBB domain
MHSLTRVIVACAGLAAGARPLLAQRPDWDPRRVEVSRESLQVLMARLEETARSPVYSGELRERSRAEAALIRERLQNGDFSVGDRIALTLEGDNAVRDTFTVDASRSITLPTYGAVSLAGVLRSELTGHLTEQLRRFVNNPVLQARALIRLSILGEVRQPGFYTLPVETLLDQALMQAGGPTSSARLDQIRIERGRQRLWDGESLERAIAEGRTLNALSVRAGDRIVVPRQSQRNTLEIIRSISILASLPFTIISIVSLFN